LGASWNELCRAFFGASAVTLGNPAERAAQRAIQMAKSARPPTASENTLDHLLVEGLSGYAIFVVDPQGLIRRWNLGAQHLFGYKESEVIGQNFSLLFTPEEVAEGAPATELAQALSGPVTGHDRWHVRKDGSRFWGMNTAQPLYDGGALLGFTKIVRDLTERYVAAEALRESAERLRALVETTSHAALHDDLTGLANKSLFREYLGRAVAHSERHAERTFAVLFIDLDNFKGVNDSLGHLLADQFLVQISRRLEQAVRTEDALARFGGDEFAILLEDIRGTQDAIVVAQHILEALREPFTIEGKEVTTTASIGIALAPRGSQPFTADSILADADLGMFQAKSEGRARYVVFRDAMRARAAEDQTLIEDLREALVRDELRMLYQPVVDVRSRNIRGFEAQVLWEHPGRGPLSPADVHPRSDESQTLASIDRWALTNAAQQLKSWRGEFEAFGSLTMSLNISPRGLTNPAFCQGLREILAQANLPPHSIAVEVTESAHLESAVGFAPVLTELRAIGFDTCVDKFGTGHLSFSQLGALPIGALKIDPSLIHGLEAGESSVKVARALIAFARGLGLKCIAEGVENEKQLSILAELGCEEAQGALFSEPLTVARARAMLDSLPRQSGAQSASTFAHQVARTARNGSPANRSAQIAPSVALRRAK